MKLIKNIILLILIAAATTEPIIAMHGEGEAHKDTTQEQKPDKSIEESRFAKAKRLTSDFVSDKVERAKRALGLKPKQEAPRLDFKLSNDEQSTPTAQPAPTILNTSARPAASLDISASAFDMVTPTAPAAAIEASSQEEPNQAVLRQATDMKDSMIATIKKELADEMHDVNGKPKPIDESLFESAQEYLRVIQQLKPEDMVDDQGKLLSLKDIDNKIVEISHQNSLPARALESRRQAQAQALKIKADYITEITEAMNRPGQTADDKEAWKLRIKIATEMTPEDLLDSTGKPLNSTQIMNKVNAIAHKQEVEAANKPQNS